VNEFCVTDDVEAIYALDDSIDPGVKAGQVRNLGLNLCLVEGGSGSEEISAKSVVRVIEDTVLLAKVSCWGILAKELNLPELAVSSFLDHLGGITGLNSEHLELHAEGGSRESVVAVEKITKGGDWHVAVLVADLGKDNSVLARAGRLKSISLECVAHIDETLGSLWSADEGHNVRVVLLRKHLLGWASIVLHGADTDDLALAEVGELQLGGKSVPAFTGGIFHAEFIGVFIKLVELGDLCDNIEITGGFLDVAEGLGLVHGDTLVLGEVLRGPLADAGKKGNFVLLPSVTLSGVCDGLVFTSGTTESRVLIRWEEAPGSVVLEVNVELAFVVVESERGAMDADDVSNSVDNREVLEAAGIQDDGGVVSGLGAVQARVDNFEGADEAALVDFVGEGGINDNTVNVGFGSSLCESDLSELGVAVTLSGGFFSNWLCCGFGAAHSLLLFKVWKWLLIKLRMSGIY
jgi:hypothetical protein